MRWSRLYGTPGTHNEYHFRVGGNPGVDVNERERKKDIKQAGEN